MVAIAIDRLSDQNFVGDLLIKSPIFFEEIVKKAFAPPRGVDMGRPLVREEIKAVYDECSNSRGMPGWIEDADGNKIGWNMYSIDAWCE